jgi:SAM-dependent methyltransferase
MYLSLSCRACGSRSVRQFLDLGAQPHCNRLIPADRAGEREPYYPLAVGFCANCTLVQIGHTVAKEEMFSDYPYVTGTTRTLVDHFKDTAERLIATYGLGKNSLVVDIGSNDGTWLAAYQPKGLRVLGVDPAANVAQLAIARGVPTWARFFNDDVAREIVAQEGEASLVTAAGVFFHLEELHSVIEGVKRLMGADGVFVVQAIYLGGMIDNLAFDQIYHEHLVYYTLTSIAALFERHGLSVIDARLLPIHGGSLGVHVVKSGRRPVRASVSRMRAEEKRKGYDRVETYEHFAQNVWKLRDDLLALLARYRREGKSVWAYGAPAKGSTLLNSFGIGVDLVDRAVEKNPMKVGFMIPGCRIPIVAESDGKPDAFLVLAWNFLAEFVEKERSYLEAGGEFIVPVPKLTVIGAKEIA